MPGRLIGLQRITAAVGEAVTLDEVAVGLLSAVRGLPGVLRAGLGVVQAGGRELHFVSTDEDALTAVGVRWCTIDAFADLPLAHAVQTGRPVHLSCLDALGERYPHLLERQRGLGTRALAALPLTTGDRTRGALLLAFDEERPFAEEEQAFLGAVAAQGGYAIRRALAYQRQQSTSELLQRSLLPQSLPEVDGLAFGAHYEAGGAGVDVGGDWYDVLPLADGSVVLALGDVMGKGVPAATVMGQLRAALRAYALLDPDPDVVLSRLDVLVDSFGVPEQLVTLAYGLLDPARRTLRLSLAGHPSPLVADRCAAAFVEAAPGPPLGTPGAVRSHVEVALPPGALVVLYSDGLVESRSRPVEDGLAQLRELVREAGPARNGPRQLASRLADRMRRPDSTDDLTVLAVAVTTNRSIDSATLLLPGDATAPRRARGFLVERLAAWGVETEVTETAELCLSEVVTNAIIHTGTAPRLSVQVDDRRLLVLVQDGGTRGVARRRDVDPDELGGRGLLLVEALCTAWQAERTADGTTVWFELERPAAAAAAAAGVSSR